MPTRAATLEKAAVAGTRLIPLGCQTTGTSTTGRPSDRAITSSSASNTQLRDLIWPKIAGTSGAGNSLKPHCVSGYRRPSSRRASVRIPNDINRRNGAGRASLRPPVSPTRRAMYTVRGSFDQRTDASWSTETSLSASSIRRYATGRVRAWSIPSRTAHALPPWGSERTSRGRPRRAATTRATSAVPSVDPSSATTTPEIGQPPARSAAIAWIVGLMRAPSSQAGITIPSRGTPSVGSGIASPRPRAPPRARGIGPDRMIHRNAHVDLARGRPQGCPVPPVRDRAPGPGRRSGGVHRFSRLRVRLLGLRRCGATDRLRPAALPGRHGGSLQRGSVCRSLPVRAAGGGDAGPADASLAGGGDAGVVSWPDRRSHPGLLG